MSSIPSYKLVKRWRLDEWKHPDTRNIVGIYIATEGEFYARIPETEVGELVRAKTRDDLVRAIRPVADRVFNLVWVPIIRAELAPPERREQHTMRSYSTQTTRWDPTDPETAGDNIRLDFQRMEFAVRDGKGFIREWPRDEVEAGPYFNEQRRVVDDGSYQPEPGVRVQLPYTEEMWAALRDFQSRIRELNHNLRTLLSHADVGVLLLQASRQKLLGLPETP
jgi:hypothetical protein